MTRANTSGLLPAPWSLLYSAALRVELPVSVNSAFHRRLPTLLPHNSVMLNCEVELPTSLTTQNAFAFAKSEHFSFAIASQSDFELGLLRQIRDHRF